ncbi:uncharacterized protein LOC111039855 [Myzus persicae]|uniref:uncharacterized protein LOC111039851 n=1 Tax=Myzus persicae TaxID=13164 RepID=UPI000B93520B|nr:uncharacterized protein LOC111039851 [Myzus persicae]XP_022179197.1 uncharacterized protein LOC111039855 [Myzus persicae]
MYGKCFREWFENVLPRLKHNAVIVMDNTLYRSMQKDKYSTKNTTKADIINWFESKGDIVDTSMVTEELFQIVNTLKPIYEKYADETVKTHNIHILSLPPYHRELNPIELIWSAIKNFVRMDNSTLKIRDVKRLSIEGVQRVNSDLWKNCIEYAVGEEEKLWNMDFMIDEFMTDENHVF